VALKAGRAGKDLVCKDHKAVAEARVALKAGRAYREVALEALGSLMAGKLIFWKDEPCRCRMRRKMML